MDTCLGIQRSDTYKKSIAFVRKEAISSFSAERSNLSLSRGRKQLIPSAKGRKRFLPRKQTIDCFRGRERIPQKESIDSIRKRKRVSPSSEGSNRFLPRKEAIASFRRRKQLLRSTERSNCFLQRKEVIALFCGRKGRAGLPLRASLSR